jgi:hypothetical protein
VSEVGDLDDPKEALGKIEVKVEFLGAKHGATEILEEFHFGVPMDENIIEEDKDAVFKAFEHDFIHDIVEVRWAVAQAKRYT